MRTDQTKHTGAKTFSATMSRERARLGEDVTIWLAENPVRITDKIVTQSSDAEYHCLTIPLFYEW